MGKGCLRLDVPAAQSYCESCRRKLEKEQGELHRQFEALNASERANQAQTPPTEKRTITHAPEQVTPSEVLNVQSPAEGKCIHYGCKMYGTPEYNGYCSKCFMEIVCTPYANSAPGKLIQCSTKLIIIIIIITIIAVMVIIIIIIVPKTCASINTCQ